MHTVIEYLPLAVMIAFLFALDGWNRRPAARARWSALSLHDKIARQVRQLRIASAAQTGLLMAFASLHQAGIVSFSGWLTGTAVSGFYLITDLYLLRHALAAQRAYANLGPLAYLAEVRHTFGSTSPGSSDRSDDGGTS